MWILVENKRKGKEIEISNHLNLMFSWQRSFNQPKSQTKKHKIKFAFGI